MYRTMLALSVTTMLFAGSATGATVSIEQVVRTGDTVPGRESLNVIFRGSAFQPFGPGVFTRPTINDAGQVVFMGRSSSPSNFNVLSTIGIYLKTPGMPLKLIVDQSTTLFGNVPSVGAPFPVPGRPSTAVFLGSGMSQLAPLINNRGDILFLDASADLADTSLPTAQGIYVLRASDGVMVKVVDQTDDVPGFPGEKFNGFFFGRSEIFPVTLNDQGQVVFLGRFRRTSSQFEDQGLYSVDIDGIPASGGTLTRLADTTLTIFPANDTFAFRSLSFSNQPALNNNGILFFQAAIGTPSLFLDGMHTIPADGSAGATTVARRGLVAPALSSGTVFGWGTNWRGHDINDAGQLLMQHAFIPNFGGPSGLFAGTVGGTSITVVADNAGGFPVPGQPAGTNYLGLGTASINESGQMGFFAVDDGPIANSHGIYAADIAGSPIEVISHNQDVPPSRVPPAFINTFRNQSVPINDLGNMALTPTGFDSTKTPGTIFGLYFFDGCTRTLERLVDDQTSPSLPPVGLGGTFGSTGQRALRTFLGHETRSGHYRSINNLNDIGFFAAFSTFDVGVYIAHVDTGGGGDLRINCPASLTVECVGIPDTSPAATGDPNVCSDNPVTVSSADVTVAGCGVTETITRTWTATDTVTSGTVSCVQTISVVDTLPPDILGIPSDDAAVCNALPPPATPTVSDDCDPAPSLALTEVQTPGSCAGEFMLTRTWTATDVCGNSTIRCQVLTIGVDAAAPLLSVPPDVTVACGDSTDPLNTGDAGATADCNGGAVVTFTDAVGPGTCGAEQVITRTWTATDTCGNTASGDQIITTKDATAPTLSAPADVTIECDADSSTLATGTATATDGCDTAPVVTFSDTVMVGSCAQGSTIHRLWSATDVCGNTATMEQTITIVDTTAPALVVPPAIGIACNTDTSPAATGTATAVDACDPGAIVSSADTVTPGSCPQNSTILRTWTTSDACGNSATGDQLVTITDTAAPTLTLPADITIECDASTDPTNTGQATASDDCDTAPAFTFSDVVTPGAVCGQANMIARTWTATDACGNSTSAVQTITVVDSTAPTLTIPLDVTVQCGASTAPSSTGQATISDNCDAAPTLTSSDSVAPGACPQESVISRTWTATDACGNAVSGVQTITVEDSVAPALTLPADATVECDADSSPTATGSATASDNCDSLPTTTFSDSVAGGVCPQASVITRTWTAADACGNAASAVQTINVVDTTAPVISLVGAGTVVLAGCVGDAYVESGATVSDNCDAGPIGVVIGGDTVDTSLPASFTILYDATDGCGNAATQITRTVNVVDSSAPTFTSLPTDLTVECQGAGGVPATDAAIVSFLGMAAAMDACDPVVGITNDAPASFPFGPTAVTWTATDAAGNNFMASRIVTVVDTTPPSVTCPAAMIASVDAACQAIIPDVTASVAATDTCSSAMSLTTTQVPAAGAIVGLGVQTITVTVTDGLGNSGQCTVSLALNDDTAPTLTVPLDAAAECDQPSDPSAAGQATAVDNCDLAPVVAFVDIATPGMCPELSTITRTWTATDASGNSASADQSVSIVDTTAPDLSCPAVVSTSGGFGGAIVTFTPSAVDACDPAPSVSSAPPSGSFFVTGVTNVSATASDTCSNASVCGFDVLVSCFGVNRAKIGTKESSCRGIEWIEFSSMNGTDEIISLYKAEEDSGGVEEDTLPLSIMVDDGTNGSVTINTSCSMLIEIGDVYGPYTVTDVKKDYDDDDDIEGNEVELRGSFVPAVPFDLAVDAVTYSIDDGMGHVASFTIPAGSFQADGNPSKAKFKFEGFIGASEVHAKFEKCKFKFKADDALNTSQLVGTNMTVSLVVGANVGEETVVMEDKTNHLKFKRKPKINCCPKCEGIASMQVTSSAGVLLFEPTAGQTELSSNTTVDDGVNGSVNIHTSCSQSIEVGDVFGPYTISELVKIYETD